MKSIPISIFASCLFLLLFSCKPNQNNAIESRHDNSDDTSKMVTHTIATEKGKIERGKVILDLRKELISLKFKEQDVLAFNNSEIVNSIEKEAEIYKFEVEMNIASTGKTPNKVKMTFVELINTVTTSPVVGLIGKYGCIPKFIMEGDDLFREAGKLPVIVAVHPNEHGNKAIQPTIEWFPISDADYMKFNILLKGNRNLEGGLDTTALNGNMDIYKDLDQGPILKIRK